MNQNPASNCIQGFSDCKQIMNPRILRKLKRFGKLPKIWFLSLLTMSFLLGCSDANLISEPTKIIENSVEVTPEIQEIHGSLHEIVSVFEDNMPRAKSEQYVIPNQSDKSSFHNIAMALIESQPASGLIPASENRYEIIKLFDNGNNNSASYILEEMQPITLGWGLYVFRSGSSQNVVIEAPHPIADKNTSQVALDLYQALDAKVLLVAGAHRDANKDGSADIAHAPESIFQTVHLTLLQFTQQNNIAMVFLQIHGFAASDHPHYPQIVIGHNWKNDQEKDIFLENISSALKDNNIQAGVCNGSNYKDLCGEKNLQSTTTDGSLFIHLELNESIRQDDKALIKSLKQVLLP